MLDGEKLNELRTELEEIREIELPQPKPGVKTSEFYIALGTQVVALLVLFGIVSTADAAEINGWIVEVVEKGGALLVLGLTAWQYIKSRAAVKGG